MTIWRPGNELFGIFPMIIGSIYVTAGAIIFGVPIGILTSVFMAYVLPEENLQTVKGSNRTACGNSVGCIWFLRPGGRSSDDSATSEEL